MFQINDFPDFLQGEQRDNTLHIQIKYLLEGELKPKKKSKSKDRTAPQVVPDLIISGAQGHNADSIESNGMHSSNSRRVSLHSLHKHHSLDDSDFLKDMSDDELDENSNSSDRMATSLPVSELKKLAMSMSDTSSENDELLSVKDGKRRSNSMSGVDTCRPLPQRPSHNPSDAIRKVDDLNTFTSQVATSVANRRFSDQSPAPSLIDTERSLPSPDIVNDAKKKSQPFRFPPRSAGVGESSSPESTLSSSSRTSSISRTRSLDMPSKDSETDSVESFEIEIQEVEIHLYILCATSPLLMHLRSTWNNYTIVSIYSELL